MCIWDWVTSQPAANFGTFIMGITAVIAAIVALMQFSAWKDQQVTMKKAEVAGQCLSAVLRFFQAIRMITSPTIDAPKDEAQEKGPHTKTYQGRNDFVNRLKLAAEDFNSFFKAMNESEVYLPDEVNGKMEELWKEWVGIKVDMGTYFNGLDTGHTLDTHHQEAYKNTFGTEGAKKRDRLENEIKALLKPIARMESGKKKNWGS